MGTGKYCSAKYSFLLIISLTAAAVFWFAPDSLAQFEPPPGSPIQAIIRVTTTADEYDAVSNGNCSLREAITAANTDTAFGGCPTGEGEDEIVLGAETYSIDHDRGCLQAYDDTNVNGDLDIRSNLVIRGVSKETTIIAGDCSALDSNPERIMHVRPPSGTRIEVEINNVTIQGGYVVYEGGGIFVDTGAKLRLEGIEIKNNTANTYGGGIHNRGNLEIYNCTVSGNKAETKHGGGLYNDSRTNAWAKIEYSTFDGNEAGSERPDHGNGGAIFNDAGNRSLDDPMTPDVDERTYAGLIIQNSTISNNQAAEDGGGLSNGSASSDQPTTQIVNSTFALNTANRNGGGVNVRKGTVTFDSVTVAENIAAKVVASGRGGGIYNFPGDGAVYLHNTLIAQNSLVTSLSIRLRATGFAGLERSDCYGTLTSQGYNYIGISGSDTVPSCLDIPAGIPGDQNRLTSFYPAPEAFEYVIIRQLQDWGGPTLTLRPMPLSSGGAIDHGDPNDCRNIDQRGEQRNLHLPCDIGAFETGGECGNGRFEATLGEECDDGNTTDTDECTSTCKNARCGDKSVRSGMETCDDGNTVTETCFYDETSCTVCDATCHSVAGATSFCGDSRIDEAQGEICDDGNTDFGDGCSESCTTELGYTCIGAPSICQPTCGDRLIMHGEACDDGNADNTDDCVNCGLARCGDTFVQTGVESCDSGGESATCNDNCTVAVCGDNKVNATAGETCDDGNTETGECAYGQPSCTVCKENCQSVPGATSFCGDDRVDGNNGETCDDGIALNGQPNRCNSSCNGTTPSVCGNGVLETDETCDDKNTNNDDGCSALCTIERGFDCRYIDVVKDRMVCVPIWGDGIVTGREACDDGNAHNNDGCSVQGDIEAGYACASEPSVCQLQICGDGVRMGTETCDEGALNNQPGHCNSTCSGVLPAEVEPPPPPTEPPPEITTPVCGNGVVEAGETCDEGAAQNGQAADHCNLTCSGTVPPSVAPPPPGEPPPPEEPPKPEEPVTGGGCTLVISR